MANRNNRKSGNNRRDQNTKVSRENKAYMRAMQSLRSSNAATPVPSGKAYSRTVKHTDRQEW